MLHDAAEGRGRQAPIFLEAHLRVAEAADGGLDSGDVVVPEVLDQDRAVKTESVVGYHADSLAVVGRVVLDPIEEVPQTFSRSDSIRNQVVTAVKLSVSFGEPVDLGRTLVDVHVRNDEGLKLGAVLMNSADLDDLGVLAGRGCLQIKVYEDVGHVDNLENVICLEGLPP